MFVTINCTYLKATFGIKVVWLQGDAFVAKDLTQACGKPCYNGKVVVLILVVKRNGNQFKDRDREIQWSEL